MTSVNDSTTRAKLRGFARPVGNSPAATYWLRRIVSLLAVAVVVAAVVRYVGSANGPSRTVESPVTATSPGAAGGEPACLPSHVVVRILSASWTVLGATMPQGIDMTPRIPSVARASLGTGPPEVVLELTDAAHTACVADLDAVGVIGEGSDGAVSWMSAACAVPGQAGQAGSVVLAGPEQAKLSAGGSVSWTLAWQRPGAIPACRGRTLSLTGAVRFYGLALGDLTKATVLTPSRRPSATRR